MLKVTYDGDKMVSRPLFTQEANKEAKEFLSNPSSVFTLDGTNYRVILNKESISGLYGLTLDDPKAKPIPDDLALELVEAQDFNKLTDVVLDKFENGKIKPVQLYRNLPFQYNLVINNPHKALKIHIKRPEIGGIGMVYSTNFYKEENSGFD